MLLQANLSLARKKSVEKKANLVSCIIKNYNSIKSVEITVSSPVTTSGELIPHRSCTEMNLQFLQRTAVMFINQSSVQKHIARVSTS